jgi:CheY-like chemotaxis protein
VRCVIVDDNAEFVEAARRLLERGGITVVGVASSGTEARALVAQLRPDVTLIDINLGAESGFALAEQLHRDSGQPPPAVILMSTRAEVDFGGLIAASHAAGFVSKHAVSAQAISDLIGRSPQPGAADR